MRRRLTVNPNGTRLLDSKREPRLLAYAIGVVLAVASTFAANAIIGWQTHWYAFPLAILLGLWGVFSIESFFEGLVVLVIASVPLAFVLCHNNHFSIGKHVWLSAIAGLGAGKLWVGIIR